MKGKRVLITGGGSGIGAATAARLAAGGWAVEIADIRPPAGGRYLDAADEPGWKAVIEDAWPLDALVNCAGIRDRSPLADMSVAQFERLLTIHATGGFIGIREVARRWQQESRPGAVVSMASVNATHAVAGQAHYVAAKAAVAGLTRAAAVELAGHGIRVNAIAPGGIATEASLNKSANLFAEASIAQQCVKRAGQPSDLIGPLMFLASEASGYVSGQTLVVDGGKTMPA